MRFLIVKPSSLGDVLHSFPAVSLLAEKHPEARLDWLIHPSFSQILDYFPSIDRRIIFKRRELAAPATFIRTLRPLIHEIRHERYDASIDLQGLMRSALLARFSRSKVYCGPSVTREPAARFFYSRKLRLPVNMPHAVDKNSSMMADFLGVKDFKTSYPLPVNIQHRNSALKLLADAGVPALSGTKLLIAVAPGARWQSKQWPPEFFAGVISILAKEIPEAVFILLGAPSESKLADRIMASPDVANTVSLCGKTDICQLVEVIRLCSLFISNDSGPMHIASAVETPVMALFGPTDPALTGPYFHAKSILQPDLDCIKCFRRYCHKGLCHTAVSQHAAADKALKIISRKAI